jgi:hypothetical protein
MKQLLTKSKYLLGLQCPGLLWVAINDKKKIPEPDISALHKFKVGTLVGELATTRFVDGIKVSEDGFIENLEATEKLLSKRKPLFEAGFKVDFEGKGEIFSRVDVLVPIRDNEWDIVEVKSGTKVKDVNLEDVSFQKYVLEKAGLKIRKCFLMHINNQYVHKGNVDVNELFFPTDITEEVAETEKGINERIENMFKIISAKKKPQICLGKHCKSPYECSLKSQCWSVLPKGNVFDLYRGGVKSHNLYDQGVILIKDVPESTKLTDIQKIQRDCAIDGKPHINEKEIKKFLDGLKYPLYYLDFETINPAIPKFDGMKPYQQIPFQYSLHIQKEKGGKCEHISFLADGIDDPRPKFLQSLKDNLGSKGDIIVYNQSFEISRIQEGIEAFPEFKKWGLKIIDRVKDLLIPFRTFCYYHPDQCGSASIKKVLPVLSKLSYADMEIGNGGDASVEYERVTFDLDTDEKDKKRVRDALEKYCELDTRAEVEIVEGMGKMVKNKKGGE